MSVTTAGTTADQDKRADAAIAAMVTAAMGGAVVPVVVSWPVAMAAMGSGVVAIGLCYGVKLTKDEAWRLVIMFIKAAGLTFCGLTVASQLLSAVLVSTGLGYGAAIALDAATCGSIAYAVGGTAKAYFKGERDKAKLGRMMRRLEKTKKQQAV